MKGLIEKSAKDNCVPEELLWAIIVNEQIDQNTDEKIGEMLGFGLSVGLAQITVETAYREGVLPSAFNIPSMPTPRGDNRSGYEDPDLYYSRVQKWVFKKRAIERAARSYLISDQGSVETAAKLINKYLKKLCSEYKGNKISMSFSKSIAGVFTESQMLETFCSCASKNCKEITKMNVPKELIQTMAAMWNNGSKILNVKNVILESPNSVAHAANSSRLDDTWFKD